MTTTTHDLDYLTRRYRSAMRTLARAGLSMTAPICTDNREEREATRLARLMECSRDARYWADRLHEAQVRPTDLLS